MTGTAGSRDAQCSLAGCRFETRSIARPNCLSKPYIQIGEYKYWEWNRQGWGPLDIYGGVAHSSDTFFYQLSRLIGLDRLTYWADQYGFGKPTGIDLPETATGIVPTNEWKRVNKGTGCTRAS